MRLLLDSAEQQTGFDVQSGEAVLRVGKAGLNLLTHVGMAMIAPNSEILLRRNGDTLGFDVALGQLNFRDRNAAEIGLESGDSVDVGIGMAVLELKRKTDKATPSGPGISIEVVQWRRALERPGGLLPAHARAGSTRRRHGHAPQATRGQRGDGQARHASASTCAARASSSSASKMRSRRAAVAPCSSKRWRSTSRCAFPVA